MATKPTTVPTWNTGGTNRTAPSAGELAAGYAVNQVPASSKLNWWMNLVGSWLDYLNGLVATANTWTATQTFTGGVAGPLAATGPAAGTGGTSGDAFVGTGGAAPVDGVAGRGLVVTGGAGTTNSDGGVAARVVGGASGPNSNAGRALWATGGASAISGSRGAPAAFLEGGSGPGGFGAAAEIGAGHLKLVGSYVGVAADAGADDVLTPFDFAKAAGLVHVAGGALSVTEGRNIGTPTHPSTTTIRVPFVRQMASADYVVHITVDTDGVSFGPIWGIPLVSYRERGVFEFQLLDGTGAPQTLSGITGAFSVVVFGRQR